MLLLKANRAWQQCMRSLAPSPADNMFPAVRILLIILCHCCRFPCYLLVFAVAFSTHDWRISGPQLCSNSWKSGQQPLQSQNSGRWSCHIAVVRQSRMRWLFWHLSFMKVKVVRGFSKTCQPPHLLLQNPAMFAVMRDKLFTQPQMQMKVEGWLIANSHPFVSFGLIPLLANHAQPIETGHQRLGKDWWSVYCMLWWYVLVLYYAITCWWILRRFEKALLRGRAHMEILEHCHWTVAVPLESVKRKKCHWTAAIS